MGTHFIRSTPPNTTRSEIRPHAGNDLIRRNDAGEGIFRSGGTSPLINSIRIFDLTGPYFTDSRVVEIDANILASFTCEKLV